MPADRHRPGSRVLIALPFAPLLLGACAAAPVPARAEPLHPAPTLVQAEGTWEPSAAASQTLAPATFADIAERQIPTVVNVSTTQEIRVPEEMPEIPGMPDLPPGSPFEEFFREFWGRQRGAPAPRPVSSLGSGFIIDASGLIVTNAHVIEGADAIRVILHDETTLDAEVVGTDAMTDIAVLRVDAPRGLPAARWGDSDQVRVGDWVMAIGNPFGLGGTVTTGILSARARDINQGPYDDYLQTDASINRGNSGGPLFNLQGEVIGINTAIFSPTGGSVGIGFATPSALARGVVDDIIRYGSPRRGWLGVQIQAVTAEIAESLGIAGERGALVTAVTPGGPAETAGIRQGDVILDFGGVSVNRMRQLPRIVAETSIGADVPVTILRNGEQRRLRVTVGDLDAMQAAAPADPPRGAPPESGDTVLGLTLAPLNGAMREDFGVPDGIEGVVVTQVAPSSTAAERGIGRGDVIVEVGQEPVRDPADVAARIRDAREAGRRTVLLLVSRQGDSRYVPLPLSDAGPG
jgi:serine protease Do